MTTLKKFIHLDYSLVLLGTLNYKFAAPYLFLRIKRIENLRKTEKKIYKDFKRFIPLKVNFRQIGG